MVRIVVCDIDNTLIPRHGELTAETISAINKLRENSILFGVASGRPYSQTKEIFKTWDINLDFVICANGCEIMDFKENKFSTYHLMKPEWFKEIIELMKPFNGNVTMVIDGIQYAQKVDETIKEACKYSGIEPIEVKSDEQFYVENSKIMIRIDRNRMEECEEYLSKHPSKFYKGFKTQPDLIEFTDINVSKASALIEYCKSKDIDIKEVWAFGDTSNDNEMLEVAGRGICLLNGTDDTKAIADDITEKTCADNGFADYLNKNLFNHCTC